MGNPYVYLYKALCFVCNESKLVSYKIRYNFVHFFELKEVKATNKNKISIWKAKGKSHSLLKSGLENKALVVVLRLL